MEDRKKVLITGSSRGLGKETAKLFASLNYDVVINYYKSEQEAFQLKQEIEQKNHVNVLAIKADISNEEDVKNMMNIVKEKFGHLDCLVNNASICMDNDFKFKTIDEFTKVLETNLVGTFIVSKYSSTIMEKGCIINISSTDALDTCYKEEMDYASSKAGIISLTKTFAKALAPNIRVNAVAPGWIDTDMNKQMSKEFKKQEEEKILLKRFARPEEVARVITFLASQDASYINASVIRVDGGY